MTESSDAGFPPRRVSGVVPEHLRLTRQDLIQWADSGAGYDLPGLLRRLVIESTEGVELVHFPAGVGAASGGWDGIVRAPVGTAFVPEGLSGWEISAAKNSNAKAEKDYSKRTLAPDGTDPAESAYVEVICRPWTGAVAFAAARGADRRWREVRALNVDDLEAWLEQSPSTTIWLAERLGHPVTGARTAEQWWEDWTTSTTVPLTADIVLAGRESARDDLLKLIRSPGVTTLGGDLRLEEARAFVAAATTTSQRDEVGAPVLFLSDSEDARRLMDRPGTLTVVAPSAAFASDISAHGHHLIVPTPGSDRARIIVPPVSSQLAAKAFEGRGLGHRDSSEYGALARRSLLALRRKLAREPSLHQPSWASPGADTLRRRVLLVNSWNQTKQGDREALETLLGQDYAAVEDALNAMAASPDDPMVALVDERWHVVSPMDAWVVLGPQLSTTDLEAFRTHALMVLLDPDPLANVPDEERLVASSRGVERRFSAGLARGAARSLALLGSVDDVVRVAGGRAGGSVAASIVHELLNAANNDATADTWVALAPHLPLLAEAAPVVLLRELERATRSEAPFASAVFADSERDQYGWPPPSPHSHVLWALEVLVWSTEHFDGAVSLLAHLATIDPGGTWANRPAASLASVFCPRHPSTSATIDQRLTTLDRLRREHPEVSWRLLLSMLPKAFGSPSIHQGPQFRDWKRAEPVALQSDYTRVVDHVAGALLSDVGVSGARWQQVVEQFDHLPPSHREHARERLTDLATEAGFEERDREAVWMELRSFVLRHREFSDASWALPTSEIAGLEFIVDVLAPSSSARRHAWLFDGGWVTLGDARLRDNYEEYERELARRRTAVVAEILEEDGLAGVVRLATECDAPGLLGAALADAAGTAHEVEILSLMDSSDQSKSGLAVGYFARQFRSAGWAWLDDVVAEHGTRSPAALARLLRATGDPLPAAERADLLGEGVAADYWKNFSYLGLGQDFGEAVDLSTRLLEFGRPAAALLLLSHYGRGRDADQAYANAILVALESLMAQPNDRELQHLQAVHFDRLFKAVAYHRHQLGVERVIRVEWFFLPMLGYDPDAPTLHQTLAENPELFVDMVCAIYPEASDASDGATRSDQELGHSENAYRLLQSWSNCPAADGAGVVTLEALREWVASARALFAERNRVEVGDAHIGEALAAAPEDPDGVWPCAPIRDLLEELRNDRIDRGLEIRLFNNRGVTIRSLDEGGSQEWTLAEGYRERAGQFRTQWPRSAAIFSRLANSYEADARREDAQAERHNRGLDR